jgi:hypothetical protein
MRMKEASFFHQFAEAAYTVSYVSPLFHFFIKSVLILFKSITMTLGPLARSWKTPTYLSLCMDLQTRHI